jgi:K+-sensing histidine kinase KdpD
MVSSKRAVLVCVTGQRDCDRLIHAGKCIAEQRKVSLQVLCVQPTSQGIHGDCKELEYLRQTSKEANAEMTVYFNNEAACTAAAFAHQVGAVHIVTGMAEEPVNGFIDVLHSLLPEVPISMVSKDGKVYNICPAGEENVPRLAYSS